MQIIEVQPKGAGKPAKVALGLSWFLLGADEDAARYSSNLVRKMKEPAGVRAYNRAAKSAEQFALGGKAGDRAPAAYSAAAAVAKANPDRAWLIALQLPGGEYWVCFGSNGTIMPDGDLVIEGEQEAFAAFLDAKPFAASEVVVPAGWYDRDELDPLRQTDVLKARGLEYLENLDFDKSMRVSALSNLKVPIVAGGLSIAAIFAIGAFALQPDPVPQQIRPAEPIVNVPVGPSDAEVRQQRHARYDQRKPWLEVRKVTDAFDACAEARAAVPPVVAGYTISLFECDIAGGAAHHDYKADWGYMAWVDEWIETNLSADTSLSSFERDGSGFTLTTTLTTDAVRNPDVSLMANADIRKELVMAANIEGASLVLGTQKRLDFGDPEYRARFGRTEVTITTERAHVWKDVLSTIPGFVLTAISSSGEADPVYTLKGEAYAALR